MNIFNNGSPIPFDSIEKTNWEKAADDFSEGLEPLKQLLICMWERNIKSAACCKGYHGDSIGILQPTQILIQENNDIFCYLSQSIIDSPYVELLKDENNIQQILIYGEKREEILKKITEDILTGKKNNLIANKIPQPQVRLESYIYGMKINGFSNDEINEIYPNLDEYANLETKAEYYEKKYGELYSTGNLSEDLKEMLDNFIVKYEEIRTSILHFIKSYHNNMLENNELVSSSRHK